MISMKGHSLAARQARAVLAKAARQRCVASLSLRECCRASSTRPALLVPHHRRYSTFSPPATTAPQHEIADAAETTPPEGVWTSAVPLAGFVDLSPRRSLIEVSGKDAFRFLHGLLTNEPPLGNDGVYAAFLNVRGRVMYDAFIYPTSHNKKWTTMNPPSDEPDAQTYLVEHDSTVTTQLLTYLKFRKLRDKVTLRTVEDWKVWYAWEDFPENLMMRRMAGAPTEYDLNPYMRKPPAFIGADDTRAPGFGVRIVLSTEAPDPLWPLRVYEEGRVERFVEADLETYDLRRIQYGIPEGTEDLSPGNILPMESCIDMMGGINFKKGCYVGQELTTRTKHIGVVPRRVVPYALYDLSQSAPESPEYNPDLALPAPAQLGYKSPIIPAADQPKLNAKGEIARPLGSLISRHGNVGLATVRMAAIEQSQSGSEACFRVLPRKVDGEGFDLESAGQPNRGIGIKLFRPYWWEKDAGTPSESATVVE
ncbi:hypothetical protein BZA70DRAFT_296862 [Myxozyma melibiosi]|uniref:Aminomethyltransferase folate-binding domain-containing protein n=1 Tax=Myxozyma melibiosi TaxID=54550 RepID=A0ABR1F0Z9_9ASCO